MSTVHSRRHFLGLSAGVAAAAALSGCAVGPGSGDSAALRAMFLPATWGQVVKDVLAPRYAAETGTQVEVQLVARDAIHEKMATLFAAQDSSFDIFNVDYNWIPEFGRAGHLLDVGHLLSDADRQDFFPTALEVATWEGTLLGIPQTIHPHLLWYRRDIFTDQRTMADYRAATGRKLAPPSTMDEWLDVTRFLTGRTYGGTRIHGWAAQAAKGFGNVHTWLSFVHCYGGSPFDDGFTRSQLSSPEIRAATARWAEMMQFMPPGANAFTYDDVTTAAQQGTIATALQWSWGAFAVDDPATSQTVGQWEFTQVPAGPGGVSSPHLAEWVISVSRYSARAEEAARFVAWLETARNDVLQASRGAGDPVRRSSYDDPTLTSETLRGSSVPRFRRYPEVVAAMETTRPRPFFPAEERWETAVSTELSAIALGERTVNDGLRRADDAVAELLRR